MKMAMKIAINGCGIGGPTLAYWLREYGHEPVLFERAPALRAGGYVIDFWGYGFDIAERMGLLEGVREDGFVVEHLRSFDAKGRETSCLDGRAFEALAGGRYTSILRTDLAKRIYAKCDGIETRFNTHVVDYSQDETGVDVVLNTGETERFDLLIGADGLHSAIRRLGFGPQENYEKPTGLNVAAFMLADYKHRDDLSYMSHSTPGRQVNRISLPDDQTLFLFVMSDDHVPQEPQTEPEQKAALRAAFADMGWETPDILARLEEVEDVYFDRVAQIRMDKWADGRVALLGDAAACASLLAGEGTSLAMLEAYILAGELHKSGGDHAVAFAKWQERLRPLLLKKQDAALRFSGFFAPRSWFKLWLRDKLTNLSSRPYFAKKFIAPMLQTDFDLPDYKGGSRVE